MIPKSWMTVSVVRRSHCFEDWDAPVFVLHRMIKPLIVITLQDSVTSSEKIPRTAKVMAKNTLPGASLFPVLMKHQVPGHWFVYSPIPAIGSREKRNPRHHMAASVSFVMLVFMWLEYQWGFVIAMALSKAMALAKKREHSPKVVIQTPKYLHSFPVVSIAHQFKSAR